MGILRTNKISGLGTDGTVFQGVTRFDTQGYFVAPSGTTEQRSAGITTAQGTIRFNTDSQKLEFYAQDQWWEMVTDTPDLGRGADTGAGARGLFGGGYTAPAFINTIQYINISSTGNSTDFGDLLTSSGFGGACASSTRGIIAGGSTPLGLVNVIQFVTISTTGNTADFGDLSSIISSTASCSNSIRGLFGGSNPTASNTIDYITISTAGNSFDFGDLFIGK